MESNKPTLISEEEYNNSIEQICDSLLSNVIEYLHNDVYVEKTDNFFTIKTYHNQKDKKEFSIRINRSEFHFNLYTKSSGIAHPGLALIASPSYNNTKEKNYETGSFTIKIPAAIFNKHEYWIVSKSNEYLLQKINSLKSNMYKDFNLEKVLKRKHVTNTIINEKEDL